MVEEGFRPQAYWETRLSENFDLKGVGLVDLPASYNRWLYRARRRAFRRAVLRHVVDVRSARVLDVGSGTGFYVDQWQALGAERIVGSDLTAVSVDSLRARFPELDFQAIDISGDLPPGLGRFDAVSAMDMLFHIVDDEKYRQAISNLRAVLEPGGVLIFSEHFRRAGRFVATHQVSRSMDEILQLLDESGLRLLERRPLLVAMGYPVDSESRLLQTTWRAMAAPAKLGEAGGHAVGAAAYPVEVLLARVLKESPATEIAVCVRHA